MDKMITRKLFGMNGKRLENFCFAKVETFEQWKSGELLFLPNDMCFTSFAITDERNEKIRYIFDDEDKEDIEWHNKWDAMSLEEKTSWWFEFIRANYVALTYEEFLGNKNYIQQNIRMTFHLDSGDVDGIIFFAPAPKDMRKIEV